MNSKQALRFNFEMKKRALLEAKLQNNQLDIKRLEREIELLAKHLDRFDD